MVFSTESLEIESPTDVKSISTSCECIRAKLVEYLDGNGKQKCALAIHFVPEENATKTSSDLAAEVNILLSSGEKRRAVVSFLHAARPAEQ